MGIIATGQVEAEAAVVKEFLHFRGHSSGMFLAACLGLILLLAGLFDHLGAEFLFFLDELDLVHIAFGLTLADLGLGHLEFGEEELEAAGGAEVDVGHDLGKGGGGIDLRHG